MNLWGADHVMVGTNYPYGQGWYDPRGFVGGAEFLKNGDKAKILALNAAKLLKITGRLGSMDIPVTKAAKRSKPAGPR